MDAMEKHGCLLHVVLDTVTIDALILIRKAVTNRETHTPVKIMRFCALPWLVCLIVGVVQGTTVYVRERHTVLPIELESFFIPDYLSKVTSVDRAGYFENPRLQKKVYSEMRKVSLKNNIDQHYFDRIEPVKPKDLQSSFSMKSDGSRKCSYLSYYANSEFFKRFSLAEVVHFRASFEDGKNEFDLGSVLKKRIGVNLAFKAKDFQYLKYIQENFLSHLPTAKISLEGYLYMRSHYLPFPYQKFLVSAYNWHRKHEPLWWGYEFHLLYDVLQSIDMVQKNRIPAFLALQQFYPNITTKVIYLPKNYKLYFPFGQLKIFEPKTIFAVAYNPLNVFETPKLLASEVEHVAFGRIQDFGDQKALILYAFDQKFPASTNFFNERKDLLEAIFAKISALQKELISKKSFEDDFKMLDPINKELLQRYFALHFTPKELKSDAKVNSGPGKVIVAVKGPRCIFYKTSKIAGEKEYIDPLST